MSDNTPIVKPRLPPVYLQLFSGGLSGLASCLLLQPLDLLKTRIQQAPDVATATGPVKPSVASAAREVVAKNGLLGLWRGTAPTVARNVPGVAVYFLTLTELRTLMTRSSAFATSPRPFAPVVPPQPGAKATTVLPKLTPTGDLIAGAVARTGVGFVLMPVTVIKARFESSLYSYPSLRAAFRGLVQEAGLPALWRGFVPTALRDAPYAGLFVLSYERSKSLLPTSLAPSAVHAVSGSVGAVVATLLTTPFDYLKTQRQLRPDVYKTLLGSAAMVLRGRKGAWGFFDGAGLRIARKAASSAVGWTIYEGLIRRWAT